VPAEASRAGTVSYVAARPPDAAPGAGPAVTAGVASLAVRDLLRGIRRHGKILAALPHAIYLEFADTVPEPRVITVSPPDAIRLPNAIITGPWDAPPRVPAAGSGDCWAGGSRVLACAVEAAEHLVGLGPGLVPSGDSVVSGVLLALRLLGGAISGGTRAVWLANWLSAAVTCDATRRTTTLAASLLHCAAKGQAGAEVSAVLLGLAGQEPLE